MKWKLFRFRLENTKLLKQWKKFYDSLPSPPVADRPEFIIPLLSNASPNSPLCLLIAEQNREIACMLPLSTNIWKNIKRFYAKTLHKSSDNFRPFISIYSIDGNDIAGVFGDYSGHCIYLHSINFDPRCD